MNSTFASTWNLAATAADKGSPPATAGLDDWPLHVPGVIQGFAAATEPDGLRTQRRMAELGFLPGESVRIVARGWLRRSPVAVRIGQSTFALRAHEAAMLRIHAVGAPA
ncbi:MAG: FeoA family protein [Burkholderiaceae bacterium]